MLKCLDTDLLIAILRGKQEAYNAALQIEKEAKAATTAINAYEIYFGAHRSQLKSQNVKEVDSLFQKLEVIPLELSSAKKAAEITSKLAAKGQLINYRDTLIAAIATVNNLTLVTRNKAHFERIKELRTQTW